MHAPTQRTSAASKLAPGPEVLSLMQAGKRFLLSGHVRPDGDCVGSQVSLHALLRELGKEVHIVNPDPLAPQYDYLAQHARFEVFGGTDLPAHDVVCVLDFSELSRCGAMQAAIMRHASKKLVIDHHLFHAEPWWDAAYVDSRAAATGTLVRRLAQALDVRPNLAMATGLFTSLVSDTGWFKYSNTDQETFETAAEATRLGVDPSKLFNSIYQRQAREFPLGMSRALALVEYHAQGRLALLALPQAEAGQAELLETDDLLDLLRSVRAVEVVLFLREQKDGQVKLSARSKTEFDVNALARRFGGGGHAKASGATLRTSLAASREALLEAALDQLRTNSAP